MAQNRAVASVLGVLGADAYGLRYHWVYQTDLIVKPIPAQLADPVSQFHKGKTQGDLSHIGDAILGLLESLHEKKTLDLADYSQRFVNVYNGEYKGWMTGANKAVLANLKENKPLAEVGSTHDDSEGGGKAAPLFLYYHDESKLVEAAKQLVAFTHNHPTVLLTTELFARATFRVIHHNATPVAALQNVLTEEPFKSSPDFLSQVQAGFDAKDSNTDDVVKQFGPGCTVNSGLPIAIHLVAKYENNYAAAMEANVGASGDSSGRGIAVAMLLAAHAGNADALPAYVRDMKCYDAVLKLL